MSDDARLARIEEKLDNHIAHFGLRLDTVERRTWWIIRTAVGTLLAAVGTLTMALLSAIR